MALLNLSPGPLFREVGLTQKPPPGIASGCDKDNQIHALPDSPMAGIYDVSNTSTSLILLNNRYRSKSKLVSHTDTTARSSSPNPKRHSADACPHKNTSRHIPCLDSSSPTFTEKRKMCWKNNTERPAWTPGDESSVNTERHLACRVSSDVVMRRLWMFQPRPRTPVRKPPLSLANNTSMVHKALTRGDRVYLWNIAAAYDVTRDKQYKQAQYNNLMMTQKKKGNVSSQEMTRYNRYLTSQRTRPYGSAGAHQGQCDREPKKRQSSARSARESNHHSHSEETSGECRSKGKRSSGKKSRRDNVDESEGTSSDYNRHNSSSEGTSSECRSKRSSYKRRPTDTHSKSDISDSSSVLTSGERKDNYSESDEISNQSRDEKSRPERPRTAKVTRGRTPNKSDESRKGDKNSHGAISEAQRDSDRPKTAKVTRGRTPVNSHERQSGEQTNKKKGSSISGDSQKIQEESREDKKKSQENEDKQRSNYDKERRSLKTDGAQNRTTNNKKQNESATKDKKKQEEPYVRPKSRIQKHRPLQRHTQGKPDDKNNKTANDDNESEDINQKQENRPKSRPNNQAAEERPKSGKKTEDRKRQKEAVGKEVVVTPLDQGHMDDNGREKDMTSQEIMYKKPDEERIADDNENNTENDNENSNNNTYSFEKELTRGNGTTSGGSSDNEPKEPMLDSNSESMTPRNYRLKMSNCNEEDNYVGNNSGSRSSLSSVTSQSSTSSRETSRSSSPDIGEKATSVADGDKTLMDGAHEKTERSSVEHVVTDADKPMEKDDEDMGIDHLQYKSEPMDEVWDLLTSRLDPVLQRSTDISDDGDRLGSHESVNRADNDRSLVKGGGDCDNLDDVNDSKENNRSTKSTEEIVLDKFGEVESLEDISDSEEGSSRSVTSDPEHDSSRSVSDDSISKVRERSVSRLDNEMPAKEDSDVDERLSTKGDNERDERSFVKGDIELDEKGKKLIVKDDKDDGVRGMYEPVNGDSDLVERSSVNSDNDIVERSSVKGDNKLERSSVNSDNDTEERSSLGDHNDTGDSDTINELTTDKTLTTPTEENSSGDGEKKDERKLTHDLQTDADFNKKAEVESDVDTNKTKESDPEVTSMADIRPDGDTPLTAAMKSHLADRDDMRTHWKTVCMRLGLTAEEITEVEEETYDESLTETIYSALMKWEDKKKGMATREAIIRALRLEGFFRESAEFEDSFPVDNDDEIWLMHNTDID